jgi:hypothetical protein
LAQAAARQTLIDIADNTHDSEEIDRVLSFTGNMPLAVDLISHLVAEDGCTSIISRWENETTSLVSEGNDRRSNLEISIALSLSSPRITSVPYAQDLLSLLSILPDGLSDVELKQTKFPIENILGCKVVLLATSLAYSDDNKRFKALVPIREYMQRYHAPSSYLILPLLEYFQELLTVYRNLFHTQSTEGLTHRVRSNWANIQNILSRGLQPDNPDLAETIQRTLTFATFCANINRPSTQLMGRIRDLIPGLNNPKIELDFICACLRKFWSRTPIENPEILIARGLELSQQVDDKSLCESFAEKQDHP